VLPNVESLIEIVNTHLGMQFHCEHEFLSNGKSRVLLLKTKEGAAVVAKTIVTEDPFYQSSFQKELQVYECFRAAPPSFAAPVARIIFREPPLIVTDYLNGTALSTERFPKGEELPYQTLKQLEATLIKLRNYTGLPLGTRDEVLIKYNARWNKYIERGIFFERDRNVLIKLAENDGWQPEFNHGDPVPSNAMLSNEQICLLDWEFAGAYAPFYDVGVLWACLSRCPKAQLDLEQQYLSMDRPYRLCFVANALNVASRELGIHRDLPEGHENKALRLRFLEPLLDRAREFAEHAVRYR